jgi:hypothetical protein
LGPDRRRRFEIGFAPTALALLLGRTRGELAEWLGSQPAAGRERTVSGQHGSYPVGLAFASRRDLSAAATGRYGGASAGRVIVCSGLSDAQRALLGVDAAWRLRGVADRHKACLAWHRNRWNRSRRSG